MTNKKTMKKIKRLEKDLYDLERLKNMSMERRGRILKDVIEDLIYFLRIVKNITPDQKVSKKQLRMWKLSG